MNNLQNHIGNYLEYCSVQKRLDEKTLKAYRIDLRQFSKQIIVTRTANLTPAILEAYIAKLHQQYAPKTIPLPTIEKLLNTVYKQYQNASSSYQKKKLA